jgi:hypothetical protein
MAEVPQVLVECSFLIPTRRDAYLSDGELHSTESWQWLDDELYARFDGRTVAPGLYEGFYRDPDTKQRVPDQSRRYIVAIHQSGVNDLRVLLAVACGVFQQKCIYLSVAGQVEFIEAKPDEPNPGVP